MNESKTSQAYSEASRPGRLSVSAVVLWISVLTAVFILLNAPSGWIARAEHLWPGLGDVRATVHSLFYRDYVYSVGS